MLVRSCARGELILLAILLLGCSRVPSCARGASGTLRSSATRVHGKPPGATPLAGPVAGPHIGQPSTDTSWSQGLSVGVNGPIPLIVVDQFGYRKNSVKVAVVREPQIGYDRSVRFAPGAKYAVVDRASGTVVKQGVPVAWNQGATDPISGDKAWWFDFSDVTAPGVYVVLDEQQGVRSVEFTIDDAVYQPVLKHAVRTYFYQRAGFEKTPVTAGYEWADGASHLGPNQDSQARSWLAKDDPTTVRDLRGGWFDAGDYNKYTSWTAHYIVVLLRAYQENPQAFGDDFMIPESGNQVPDLLDEVAWGLEWLQRMQNPDGSLLCVQGLAAGSPPSAASGPSYYGPPTTAASLMGAAAFAYASIIYSAQGASVLKSFGARLASRAQAAWDWANRNPHVTYYNNDDSRQSGSSGLASGQQEMDDAGRLFAKLEAAVYLYQLTRDPVYQAFVESNYPSILSSSAPTQWDTDRQETLLYYAALDGIASGVGSRIVKQFASNILSNPDQWPLVVNNRDPYRAPMKDYGWGSNSSKAMQARLYQLWARHVDAATAAAATSAAEQYLHYLHGVNPLGLVYLTNMKRAGAEHSARTMFHTWFTDGDPRWDETTDAAPGPAPGYLVGGPNPDYTLDSCCSAPLGASGYHCGWSNRFALCKQSYSPPRGQPRGKSYLQFNCGWPVNSWSVTEPSNAYQSQYVRVLAAYAQ